MFGDFLPTVGINAGIGTVIPASYATSGMNP